MKQKWLELGLNYEDLLVSMVLTIIVSTIILYSVQLSMPVVTYLKYTIKHIQKDWQKMDLVNLHLLVSFHNIMNFIIHTVEVAVLMQKRWPDRIISGMFSYWCISVLSMIGQRTIIPEIFLSGEGFLYSHCNWCYVFYWTGDVYVHPSAVVDTTAVVSKTSSHFYWISFLILGSLECRCW